MKILQETALTYDDVLLVPQYSDVDSRRMISTQTRLTNQIIADPIVSANMDVGRKVKWVAMARGADRNRARFFDR
jgi:IMP dehydrogenase/GMP reductase